MTDACGNFGAPPKPPWSASKLSRNLPTAASSAPSLRGSADGDSCAPAERRSRRRSPPARISAALALQDSAIACSTCVHAGMPWRGAGGK